MKLSDFLVEIGKPFFYYPELAQLIGDVKATILLCHFFWKVRDQGETITDEAESIYYKTGLTWRAQKSARNKLISLGLLEEKHKRLEHRTEFTLVFDQLNELWEKGAELQRTQSPNRVKRNSGNAANAIRKKENDPKNQALSLVIKDAKKTNSTSTLISSKDLKTKIAVKRVVERINELSGRNFREDSKQVNEYLAARVKAGASAEECLKVVDNRWRAWKSKPDMHQYLNPVTLFRPGNFERYLVEANAVDVSDKSTQEEKTKFSEFLGRYK